jgi:hypothetical protein
MCGLASPGTLARSGNEDNPDLAARSVTMKAERYRAIIQRLGMSEVGAAKFLDIGERTSRRWASDREDSSPPLATEMLLEFMLMTNMLPNDLRKRLHLPPLKDLGNPQGRKL